MYKVYLSPSTQEKSFGVGDFGTEEFRMNQIADIVEQSLLKSGEYAVFRNVNNMTKDEIVKDSNELKPNIHIAIHSSYGSQAGPSCYIKAGDETSNGFGKEIYKEIMKMYYDKQTDNGLFYDEKIIEINNTIAPAILIIVGNHENSKDARWIIDNITNLGEAVAKGIQKGFTLKVC